MSAERDGVAGTTAFGEPPSGGLAPAPDAPHEPPALDVLAFVALTTSATALAACFCCAWTGGACGAVFSALLAVAGTVLGALAWMRIRSRPDRLRGGPAAAIAITIGVLAIAIAILSIALGYAKPMTV